MFEEPLQVRREDFRERSLIASLIQLHVLIMKVPINPLPCVQLVSR